MPPGRPPRRRRRRRARLRLLAIVVVVLAAAAVAYAALGRGSARRDDPPATTTGAAARRPLVHSRRLDVPVAIPGPLPGALLIADRGNDRTILVDPSHRVLWRFPTAADVRKGRSLTFDDDTFVVPGGKWIISNEEEAHTIVEINIKTHAERHVFGRAGVRGGGASLLNTPDDAYALPDGTITVADAYNCRILFIRAHRIVRQYGESGVCAHDPPRTFGAVNGDTPTKGGGVLVSEIQGSWIDSIGPTGRLNWDFQAPVAYPSDPQPLPGGRILLADYTRPGAILIVNRRGRVLWRYGPTSGWAMLDHPSLALELPNGDIAVNDDYRNRVVVIDPRKTRIVWQYGRAASPGRGPNQLDTPDGMDFVPLGPQETPLWPLVRHP